MIFKQNYIKRTLLLILIASLLYSAQDALGGKSDKNQDRLQIQQMDQDQLREQDGSCNEESTVNVIMSDETQDRLQTQQMDQDQLREQDGSCIEESILNAPTMIDKNNISACCENCYQCTYCERNREHFRLYAEPIASNCLSYPVIYANGSMTPRGTFGEEMFEGQFEKEYACDPDVDHPGLPHTDECPYIPWYYQQDPLNEWQAQSMPPSGIVEVHWIDWGDNLESRPWTTNSIVRVETVLYKNITEPMIGYQMTHISGLGVDEMWGTNTHTYSEYLPVVYASDARITIQYIPSNWTSQDLEWNLATLEWTDPGFPEELPSVVMDDPYTAEVNVKGKVVHGCNWNLRTTAKETGEGLYRITMSFSEGTKTSFALAQIMSSTEIESAEEGEPQGGVPAVDAINNLTYIDIPIVKSNGRGGGGNGGSGSGGGGSGGGGSGGGGSGGGGSGGGGSGGGGGHIS